MCTYPVVPQLRETAAIGQSAAPFATDSPHLVMTDFGKPNVKANDVKKPSNCAWSLDSCLMIVRFSET